MFRRTLECIQNSNLGGAPTIFSPLQPSGVSSVSSDNVVWANNSSSNSLSSNSTSASSANNQATSFCPVLLPQPPTKSFSVAISYVIYCEDKAKSKRNIIHWKTIKPLKDFSITVNPNDINWETFQDMVQQACEKQYKSVGKIIMEGSTGPEPTIEWQVHILKSKNYAKSAPVTIVDAEGFNKWVQEIISGGKDKKAGVTLQMANPKNPVIQAQNEDLIAHAVRKIDARKSSSPLKRKVPGGDDVENEDEDDGGSSGPDCSNLELKMEAIFNANTTHTKYDRVIPVFLHPQDPDKFIYLTIANVTIWARAICNRTPGVSLHSPPPSLPYESLKKRKNLNENAESTLSSGNEIAKAINNFAMAMSNLASGANSTRDPSTSTNQDVPPNATRPVPTPIAGDTGELGMSAYVKFCGIVTKHNETLKRLIDNDIECYRMFLSTHLTFNTMVAMGLTPGVVSRLLDNVYAYYDHLQSDHLQSSVS